MAKNNFELLQLCTEFYTHALINSKGVKIKKKIVMQHSSTQTWVLVLQTWQQVKLTNVSLVGACLFRPPQTTKHGQIVELHGHAHIFFKN